MKRTWIAAAALLLCLSACGNKTEKADRPAAALPTITQATEAAETEPAETTAPAETEPEVRDVDFYSGTWTVVGIQANGVDFTLEQAVAMGLNQLEHMQIILAADGTAYAVIDGEINAAPWETADDGIRIESESVPYQENHLILKISQALIYFEKTSDDQTLPEAEEAEPTEPETEPASGLRKEFKDAMDSYEAFYNDYIDFMEKYLKNPTDFSLLAKYAGMLTKAEEMDKSFNAWNDSDLTGEELQYYLDVMNRVQKRLVGLF